MAKNRRKHAWFVFTIMVTLFINLILIVDKRCMRSSVVKVTASGTIFLGFEPRRGRLLILLLFVFCFFNLLFFF